MGRRSNVVGGASAARAPQTPSSAAAVAAHADAARRRHPVKGGFGLPGFAGHSSPAPAVPRFRDRNSRRVRLVGAGSGGIVPRSRGSGPSGEAADPHGPRSPSTHRTRARSGRRDPDLASATGRGRARRRFCRRAACCRSRSCSRRSSSIGDRHRPRDPVTTTTDGGFADLSSTTSTSASMRPLAAQARRGSNGLRLPGRGSGSRDIRLGPEIPVRRTRHRRSPRKTDGWPRSTVGAGATRFRTADRDDHIAAVQIRVAEHRRVRAPVPPDADG